MNIHTRAHSFQALVDKESKRYRGKVPRIAINHMHINDIFIINNNNISIKLQ